MTAALSPAPGWCRPCLPLALGAVVAGRRRCPAAALPRLTLLDGGTLSATDLAGLAQWARSA